MSAPFEPTASAAAAAAAAAALQQHQPKSAACRPVAEFLFHLTRMLSDPANHHLIEWDAGRIVVHDPPAMETEVLGKYFRHSKYSSFQRQLNYFGFKKISGKGKMSPCSYINDAATADLGCLLTIRRKTATKGIEKREREAALAAAKAAKSGSRSSKDKSSSSSSKKSGKSKSKSGGKNGSKSSSSSSSSSASSPKRIRVRKSSSKSSSSNKSKSIAVVSQTDLLAPPAYATTMMTGVEYSQQSNASWAPPANAFGDHLSADFDPFVVSAEEFGPPATVRFHNKRKSKDSFNDNGRQVTPSTSASSSSTNLASLGASGRPAETLCLPPPAVLSGPATSSLETTFHQALRSQQHQQLLQKALDTSAPVVSQQLPQQDKREKCDDAPAEAKPFSVPNPLMSVPNPLMVDSSHLPSPCTVAAVPTSMPSPATAAMNARKGIIAAGSSSSHGPSSDDQSDDLSAGFPPQPALSSAHQTIAQMLSTTIPDATDLFSSTAHLPSKLGGASYPGMLSPNSSLVNLAMLPTL
eukprot:CAMPEP_0181055768 /NCGR_PEP_ID=MMETSP1070-20121207/19371_1 /TAXON_ID=265543 /ORGANISM="Minutocellus polymorphus, Strain NH13" /LENGTH=523 /DNA_ID=CAMNT_0023135093 /DNA_START=200 /DNA_END=1771 /DNA_ORIENTATION=-